MYPGAGPIFSQSRHPVWRLAHASVAGSKHRDCARPCEDGYRVVVPRDGRPLILAAADGAGSVGRARAGSELAVRSVTEALAARLRNDTGADRDEIRAIFEACFRQVRGDIQQLAHDEGATRGDYASTLLFAAIWPDSAAFMQIGDGVIAFALEGAGWTMALKPHRGRYANETRFVTDDDAEEQAVFRLVQGAVTRLAVLTDGLQGQVLEGDEAISSAFLDPLLSTLARASEAHSEILSAALTRFLESGDVEAHTDDDRTLILAVRASDQSGSAS